MPAPPGFQTLDELGFGESSSTAVTTPPPGFKTMEELGFGTNDTDPMPETPTPELPAAVDGDFNPRDYLVADKYGNETVDISRYEALPKLQRVAVDAILTKKQKDIVLEHYLGVPAEYQGNAVSKGLKQGKDQIAEHIGQAVQNTLELIGLDNPLGLKRSYEEAQEVAEREERYYSTNEGFAGRAARGATASLSQAIPLAVAGGTAVALRGVGAVGYALKSALPAAWFGSQVGLESFEEARANDFSVPGAAGHAAIQTLIEAGITIASGALGKGGGEALATGIRASLKDVGIAVLQEVAEEELIWGLSTLANAATGVRELPDGEDATQQFLDTAAATVFATGAMAGSGKAVDFISNPSRKNAKAAGLPAEVNQRHRKKIAELAKDALTAKQFKQQLDETATSPEEAKQLYSLVEARAEATGVTTDEYVGTRFKEVKRGSEAEYETDLDALLAQEGVSPAWYSPARKSIESLPNDKAPVNLSWLTKQRDVKHEMLEWSGLADLIRESKGQTVTKAEALAFLKEDDVRVEEVTKGRHDFEVEARQDDKDHWTVFAGPRDINSIERIWPNGMYRLNRSSGQRAYDTLEEALAEAKGIAKNTREDYQDDTGYSNWQTPGGENYKEMLITLPTSRDKKTAVWLNLLDRDKNDPERLRAERQMQYEPLNDEPGVMYETGHFEEGNILAHLRFNERTDADGKRVLFIEEIQSDWHQEGRKRGYGDTGVPDAPFKKSWPLLAMKRAIRYAAENGLDRVAWANGEMQAERYDLSAHISEVHYSGTNLKAYDHEGDTVIEKTGVSESQLEDYIGKEATQKLLEQPKQGTLRSLKGQDLKVGGEGLKSFYDKMLPSAVNKFIKRYKSRVGKVDIGEPAEYAYEGGMLSDVITEGKEVKVPGFDITPEMRDSALSDGMPLFQKQKDKQVRGTVKFAEDGRAIIHAFSQQNVSTLLHEIGHVFRRDLDTQQLGSVTRWAGLKETSDWTAPKQEDFKSDAAYQKAHQKWRNAEEKFARGFERYLREGKAPTKRLASVFKKYKEWLKKVYATIKGSPLAQSTLNDDVRATLDGFFRGDSTETPSEARSGPPSLPTQAPANSAETRNWPGLVDPVEADGGATERVNSGTYEPLSGQPVSVFGVSEQSPSNPPLPVVPRRQAESQQPSATTAVEPEPTTPPKKTLGERKPVTLGPKPFWGKKTPKKPKVDKRLYYSADNGKGFIRDATSRNQDMETVEDMAAWIEKGFGPHYYEKYLDREGVSLGEAVARAAPWLEHKGDVLGQSLTADFVSETDSLAKSLTTSIKRWFHAGGLANKTTRNLLDMRKGYIAENARAAQYAAKDLKKAAKKRYKKVTEVEAKLFDEAMKDPAVMQSLPPDIAAPLSVMRDHIDNLSRILRGLPGIAQTDLDITITNRLGKYITGTYKKFESNRWARKAMEDPQIMQDFADHVRQTQPNMTDAEISTLAQRLLAKDINGLGSSSGLSPAARDYAAILKKKKNLPLAVRRLYGENVDAFANYTTSITKIASLVANRQFVTDLKAMGIQQGFFSDAGSLADPTHTHKIDPQLRELQPLANVYMTPEMKEAIDEVYTAKVPSKFAGITVGAMAYSKAAATLQSWTATMRNLKGGLPIMVANGSLNPAAMLEASKSVWWNDLAGKGGTANRQEVARLTRLGLISGVTVDELNSMTDQMVKTFGDPLAAVPGWANTKKGYRAVAKFYQSMDAVRKVATFYDFRKTYRKAFPNMSDAKLDRYVADLIHDIDPSYDRASRAVRSWSRYVPFGPFVTFNAEMLRTSANRVRIMSRELTSGNPHLMKMGARKLVGQGVAMAGIEAAIMALHDMWDVDDEELEAIRQRMAPWSTNSNLLVLEMDRAKQHTVVVDMSYEDPFNVFKKTFTAARRGKPGEAFEEATNFITGEDILAGGLLSVLRNQDSNGRPIYDEGLGPDEQNKQIAYHTAKLIEPGTMRGWQRIQASDAEKKIIEVVAFFTGFRVTPMSIEKSNWHRNRDAARKMRTSASSILATLKYKSVEEAESLLQSAAKKRQDIFNEWHEYSNGTATLGDEPLVTLITDLKGAMGGSNDLANQVYLGRYQPYLPAKSTVREILKKPGGAEKLDIYLQIIGPQRATLPQP